MKSRSERDRRYNQSEKGRARNQRYEATPYRKLLKQLDEMTRIRIRL